MYVIKKTKMLTTANNKKNHYYYKSEPKAADDNIAAPNEQINKCLFLGGCGLPPLHIRLGAKMFKATSCIGF